MQHIEYNKATEVQALCEEILDDVEILTNLIYLLKDQHSTAGDRQMYLKLTDEKVTDLREIIRRHYDFNIKRFN
jgi:hypothetical protein